MKRFRLVLTAFLMVVSVAAFAQKTITVTGTVTDASTGEPLSGAAILIKGTPQGTVADADGRYSITVAPNATLGFTTIGFKDAEIAVVGRSVINVALEPDVTTLDDVVVVAYGTAKKSSFTGSAGTVKSENIEKRTVTNVSKALEGLVAGVATTSGGGQPGSEAGIQIRGYGSISASSSPLYVVDGIPYDGAISALNPEDIESMTVLKDASATALYGSRGANGVIMITTKRGKDGTATVNFKAEFGVQSRSINRYDMVSQDEFVELTYEALRNNYYINGGYPFDYSSELALAGLSSALGGEHYNPYKNYTWATVIDPETGKVRADAVSAWNEDWMDEMTNKKAFRQNYQVGVQGGNSKTKYNFSAGFTDDKGILANTNFRRYSIKAGVDHNVTKWMQAGANLSYSYTDQNQSQYGDTQTGNAWYTAQFMAPIYPMYLKDAEGKDVLDENGNRQYDYGENGRPKGNNFNALGDLYDNKYQTLADNGSFRTYLNLGGNDDCMGALKGLQFSVNFGADLRNRNITSYYNPYHGDGKSVEGEVDKYATRTLSYTFNQILKYDRKFDRHHVLAQAGHEYYNYNYKYLYAERTKVYPGIEELAPAVNVTSNNSYSDNYRIESFFTRLAYDFDDKYYLEGTWRTDGSSRFHQDSRWGQFWSVGGSWRMSQENFMKNVSFINNLTLRASYGQIGNDSIGLYAWQSFYDLTWPNASNSGAIISSLENKLVSWEKKGTFNAGLDATMFNSRFNIIFEYYNAKTTDLLLSSPLAMSTGFTGYNANMGSMKNEGFELTLKYNWINTKNVRATSTLMGSTNKNTVLQLNGDERITSGSQVIEIGKPIYSWYMVKTAGVDPATGQALYWAYETDDDGNKIEGSDYVTKDKTVAANHKYYLGDPYGKVMGSFGSDFQFGPVDFSFLTTFQVGGKIYDGVYASALEATYAGDTWSKHTLRRWQKPGDVTDVPAVLIGSANTIADRALIDASYFAIKSIQLGYTLPAKVSKKLSMQALRIFVTGDNLFMFNKLNGMDPQYNLNGGQNWSYTPTRTVSLGLNLTF